MMRLSVLALLTASLLTCALRAEEAPGLAVGTAAPELKGKWITSDGKTPDLAGKVLLLDFWFEG